MIVWHNNKFKNHSLKLAEWINQKINLKTENMEVIIGLVIIVIIVFVIRAFGAWMLRIDKVIDIQKEILKELKSRK